MLNLLIYIMYAQWLLGLCCINYIYMFTSVGKSCVDKLTIEDFCKCKTPRKAFRKLSSRMLDFLSYADFNKIRRVCIEDANSPDGIELPSHIVDAISCTNNINELFDTLANSHYWNWIDVRMLEVMVDVAEIPEAEQTLDDYKKFVSPFKIKQILPDLQFDVVSKNYTTIQEKFKSSDEETLTVGDILEHQFYLAYEICDINPQSMKLRSIKTGCLELVLAIPKESTLHAYKSALKNVHKFDKIHSLVVENHPMICPPGYSPLDVVPGMIIISQLLILIEHIHMHLPCVQLYMHDRLYFLS